MKRLTTRRPVVHRMRVSAALALALVAWTRFDGAALGQGIALRAVSPINESMAGVATATPVDATGAIQWNPATISGLPSSDMSFGMAVLLPRSSLASQVGPVFGSTDSEPGAILAPNMAFVRKVEGSSWSYGLGMFAVAGSIVNYPASLTNPILSPTPPFFGRLTAEAQVYQITPTIAYQLNDYVSIGAAPTVTIARLIADPLFLGPLNPTTHDYSSGAGTRYAWGGGVQAGVYIDTHTGWNYGFSFKSQQWMEHFRFNSADEFGRPRHVEYSSNYPMILSVGASYSGWENWIIGCDVRYFDYANTIGFGHGGFRSDGSLSGLAWNSIMSAAVGAQRLVGDKLFLRGGYCFNQNPIDSAAAQINVASPLIGQHSLHAGFSYAFDENWLASVAYAHSFSNSVSGPLQTVEGRSIPASSVTSAANADLLSFGVSKRF